MAHKKCISNGCLLPVAQNLNWTSVFKGENKLTQNKKGVGKEKHVTDKNALLSVIQFMDKGYIWDILLYSTT